MGGRDENFRKIVERARARPLKCTHSERAACRRRVRIMRNGRRRTRFGCARVSAIMTYHAPRRRVRGGDKHATPREIVSFVGESRRLL